MNIAFVTHFCPHYRVKTFERLAEVYNLEYFFYSQGKEWYGQGIHGVYSGKFQHTYLPGFQLTRRTRVAPALLTQLWHRNYDVIVKCINGRFALPAAYLTARLRGIPFVLWTCIWMTLQTPFHRLALPVTRWIYRHADAIVAEGVHVRSYLVEQGVQADKIFVARPAVDNSLYSPVVSSEEKARCRANLSLNGRKVVLYLGRLEESKGIEYLIRAFAQLRLDDAVLVIVGDGALRKSLCALVYDLGIQANTRFAGYVSPNDALPYYAVADVFVLPSITMPTGKEPWGLVVNEAMNQGLPVIATDAVGAAAGGLVQSGVNGFVVPERDSRALAKAMERILTDVNLRADMSQNARRIIAGCDNERMINGFQQAIEYALQHREARGTKRGILPATDEDL